MKILGWLIGVGIITFLAIVFPYQIDAETSKGFTLNLLHNDKILEEAAKKVELKLNDEFQIFIRNENDKRCLVEIYVHEYPVSDLGDYLIPAKGKFLLSNYLGEKLELGDTFKFTEKNMLVRVKFRLEKSPSKEWYVIKKKDFKKNKLPEWWNVKAVIIHPKAKSSVNFEKDMKDTERCVLVLEDGKFRCTNAEPVFGGATVLHLQIKKKMEQEPIIRGDE